MITPSLDTRCRVGGVTWKSKFLGLGGVLETSFSSTTLQEVGIFSTLVYFHPRGLILRGMLCRGLKGLFCCFRNCLKLFLWLICGLVWLWCLVRTKDVKKNMICEWLRGNSTKNFPRPLSLFFAITWLTDLQIR